MTSHRGVIFKPRIRSALLASPFDVNAVLTETKSRMALQSNFRVQQRAYFS